MRPIDETKEFICLRKVQVTPRGQYRTTIPKQVADSLGLLNKDDLEFKTVFDIERKQLLFVISKHIVTKQKEV